MFKEYPSIDNSYQKNAIDNWLKKYPELKDCKYIIWEKLHGSNFAIIITRNEIKYQSRNKILNDDDFFGYKSVVKRYMDDLYKIQRSISQNDTIIHLYCELIGSGVQKGVKYTNEKGYKEIRVFDLYVNGVKKLFLEAKTLLEITCGLTGGNSFDKLNNVPLIAFANNLNEALNYDTNFDSKILKEENNICEGIVLSPLYKNYYATKAEIYPWLIGSEGFDPDTVLIFALKKKNEKFIEKQKAPKQIPEQQLNCLSSYYLNESRILSVFSKHGNIIDTMQLSKYITLIKNDIEIDAKKDGLADEIIKQDLKKLGSVIAIELKKYL